MPTRETAVLAIVSSIAAERSSDFAVASSERCFGTVGGLRTQVALPEEERFICGERLSPASLAGLWSCGNLSEELFLRMSRAARRAPPAELPPSADGNRLQLELLPDVLLCGAPAESLIWYVASLGFGESGSSPSPGRRVLTLGPGELELALRRRVLVERIGESALPLLVGGEGDGGGFGLFRTFAQIGMWRSAASLLNCREQCGQVTILEAGGREVAVGAGTDSPRACLQIC